MIPDPRCEHNFTCPHPVGECPTYEARHIIEERDRLAAEVERLHRECNNHVSADIERALISQLQAERTEVERLRAALSRVEQWTHEHGAALVPRVCADTYGEGMREAKKQVAALAKESK